MPIYLRSQAVEQLATLKRQAERALTLYNTAVLAHLLQHGADSPDLSKWDINWETGELSFNQQEKQGT